jgi:bifunctional non-homologous end joining protein LigD
MLARSGPIPTRGDWSYEVKWDGFRAIVSTEREPLRIRSRRGWNMTELVPELSALPVAATFDGELVAFGDDGRPDFPLLCERRLARRSSIPITYMVFDLLSIEGNSTARTGGRPEAFEDGAALFEAVCERELEGIVAKRRARPGRTARGARLDQDQEPRLLAVRTQA